MTTMRIVRLFFLMLAAFCGYYMGSIFMDFAPKGELFGTAGGLMFGALFILTEIKLRQISLRNLSAAVFGLAFGFFVAWILTRILGLTKMDESILGMFQIVFTLVFCYMGMAIAIKGKDEFNLIIPYVRFSREEQDDKLYLVDTSVIIDGRITGVCEAGFVSGKLLVPRFVLQELQSIADSKDDAKRARGRRGLDMLEKIKSIKGMEVIIHDEGLSDIKEVDAKLVRLAKMLNCSVVTNDFNLNKVATVEGVKIHNINDLANALRPVVFPGEQMNVHIKREGKERNQGVAFMEDGTMLVVDNGRKLIGKNAKVSVTSVLQTSAGKMIFANLVEDNNNGKKPQDSQQQK